jgi:hypothetical protein
MVFFHKYFLFKKSFENDFEKYLTCAACVFISVKVCNQLTPLKELVTYFLKLYKKQKNLPFLIDEKIIFETSEKMCLFEFEVLNCIGFDLNLDLPYKYVHSMKFYYLEYLKDSKLIIITTNFINDSFKLPLCLNLDPLLIALASLYLASLYFKIPLPKTKEGTKWFQLIDKNIKLDVVISVSEKINKIYKFTNEKNSQRKSELTPGVPVIKFEPMRSILAVHENNKSENKNESNLDVNESVSGLDNESHDHINNNDCQYLPSTSVNLLETNGV